MTSDGTGNVLWENVGGFVTGMIMMYTGSTAPTGWAICDGNNGTPNLVDKFIIGGHTYNSTTNKWETNVTGSLTQTGGSANAVLPAHDHNINHAMTGSSGNNVIARTMNNNVSYDQLTDKTAIDANGTETTGASATLTGTNANLPPYYALCYIMKT